MSDRRSRALERNPDDLDAHVRLLAERLRAGELDLGRLGLAAHLGHPAARTFLGPRAPELDPWSPESPWRAEWEAVAEELTQGLHTDDRVWFPGNPWPRGHALAELSWVGRLEAETLCFRLGFQSADYYAELERDDPDEDYRDWHQPIVWGNYHACSVRPNEGVAIGTAEHPFDLDRLGQEPLRVDSPPPESWDDYAFHTYLLGHDSVAEHRILLTPRGDGSYRLGWSGRIALTYAGDEVFRYRFYAQAQALAFSGFGVPPDRELDDAERQFARLVRDPARYRLDRATRTFLPR